MPDPNCRAIVQWGAEFALALKENQGKLYEDVKDLFAGADKVAFRDVPHDSVREVTKDHGRLEIRECWVLSDAEYLNYVRRVEDWKNLRNVVRICTEVRHEQTTLSRETRYFISSLTGSAQEMIDAVRGHWGIENGLHWVLDVTFREDDRRVRKDHAPENFAILWHMALAPTLFQSCERRAHRVNRSLCPGHMSRELCWRRCYEKMKYLKRSFLALLVTLTLFFNIERLRLDDGVSVVDIQSFVYALGTIAVITTIIAPLLWRVSVSVTLILWTAIYLLLKVVVLPDDDHPLIGDINIYVTFTEAVFLGILAILARNVARDLNDFEQAVENVTLDDANRRVQQLEDAATEIETELVRSRRHHRPLAVVVVEPHKESLKATLHRTVQQVQQAMMSRYVFTSLGRLLATTVRRTDFVFADSEKNRFIVFCPETSPTGSLDLVNRIYTVSSTKIGVSVSCGIGTFPEEALTFEELVHQAELHRDVVPMQSARADACIRRDNIEEVKNGFGNSA